MRRLSTQLTSDKSMTSIIHADLPFDTPLNALPSTLAEASELETHEEARSTSKRARAGSKPTSEPKTSFSDETVSTFSCVSDLLPDETNDVAMEHKNDAALIARIAQALAHRRQIDPASLMPKLAELLSHASDANGNACNSLALETGLLTPKHTPIEKSLSSAAVQKHPSLMKKASSFFHRLRPQANTETSLASGRRYSFEEGDDMVILSSPLTARTSQSTIENRLRKSVSLSSLRDTAQRARPVNRTLSPVAQSPPTSTQVLETRRVSKIPTPVQNWGTVARPRRERDNSASSLLTAFKYSDGTHRSGSLSGSLDSNPSYRRLMKPLSEDTRQQGNHNDILDHTNALRGHVDCSASMPKSRMTGAAELSSCNDHDHHAAIYRLRPCSPERINDRPDHCRIPDMSEPGEGISRPMANSSSLGESGSNNYPEPSNEKHFVASKLMGNTLQSWS